MLYDGERDVAYFAISGELLRKLEEDRSNFQGRLVEFRLIYTGGSLDIQVTELEKVGELTVHDETITMVKRGEP